MFCVFVFLLYFSATCIVIVVALVNSGFKVWRKDSAIVSLQLPFLPRFCLALSVDTLCKPANATEFQKKQSKKSGYKIKIKADRIINPPSINTVILEQYLCSHILFVHLGIVCFIIILLDYFKRQAYTVGSHRRQRPDPIKIHRKQSLSHSVVLYL